MGETQWALEREKFMQEIESLKTAAQARPVAPPMSPNAALERLNPNYVNFTDSTASQKYANDVYANLTATLLREKKLKAQLKKKTQMQQNDVGETGEGKKTVNKGEAGENTDEDIKTLLEKMHTMGKKLAVFMDENFMLKA